MKQDDKVISYETSDGNIYLSSKTNIVELDIFDNKSNEISVLN